MSHATTTEKNKGNFGRFSGCSCQQNLTPGYKTAPKWHRQSTQVFSRIEQKWNSNEERFIRQQRRGREWEVVHGFGGDEVGHSGCCTKEWKVTTMMYCPQSPFQCTNNARWVKHAFGPARPSDCVNRYRSPSLYIGQRASLVVVLFRGGILNALNDYRPIRFLFKNKRN